MKRRVGAVFSLSPSTLMSQGTPLIGPPPGFGGNSFDWVQCLPDGAVSVENIDGDLVLRASQKLQDQFEELLIKHKAGSLTAEESQQYDALCELDDALSWINRLARGAKSGT
jgi:hypothetical protein